jgi:hypothetical protein
MPEIDLQAHAAQLGDVSRFFIHESAGRALIVEHATGEPRFTVEADGTLSPYVPGPFRFSLAVANPPGFAGFPTHDKSDPAFDPATHGLAGTHFTHWETARPMLVEHSTGLPTHEIVDGQAVPIAP